METNHCWNPSETPIIENLYKEPDLPRTLDSSRSLKPKRYLTKITENCDEELNDSSRFFSRSRPNAPKEVEDQIPDPKP